jgi:hypothetical protein
LLADIGARNARFVRLAGDRLGADHIFEVPRFGSFGEVSPQAKAQDAFYQTTGREIAGPVGSLIRKEPRVGAAAEATAHKVLYRSTSLLGR